MIRMGVREPVRPDLREHLGPAKIDRSSAAERSPAAHEHDLLVGAHVLQDLVRRDQPTPLLRARRALARALRAELQGLTLADALRVRSALICAPNADGSRRRASSPQRVRLPASKAV